MTFKRIQSFAVLGAAVLMAAQAAAVEDFDYSDNKGFLRRYPDLACVDTGPLPREEAERYTADSIQALGRQDHVQVTRPPCFSAEGPNATAPVTETISGAEALDRLYARLSSGPIPHGFFDGKVILSRDRGVRTLSDLGLWMPAEQTLESVMQRLWSGKFFDHKLMYLKNRINLDGLNWNEAPASLSHPRMKFPAKLYCGQSLFDSRRESIIIDYKYGVQDLPQGLTSDPAIDWLAGPTGLGIRDEVRMVKPGLYLGRAYLKMAFGLYFVLQFRNGTQGDEPVPSWDQADSCWLGHQRQIKLGKRPSDYLNNPN